MILLLFTVRVLSFMSSHCSSPFQHYPAHFHTHQPSLSNHTWLPSVVPAGELLLMLLLPAETVSPQIPQILANFCMFSGVRLHDGFFRKAFWPWDLRFSSTFSFSPVLQSPCTSYHSTWVVYIIISILPFRWSRTSVSLFTTVSSTSGTVPASGQMLSSYFFFNDGWIE